MLMIKSSLARRCWMDIDGIVNLYMYVSEGEVGHHQPGPLHEEGGGRILDLVGAERLIEDAKLQYWTWFS